MTQLQCAALFFDLDGVLINSTPAVERVWRRWAIEHGFNPEEAVARAHGRPSITTVREYLPNADHEAENREVERREIEDLEGVVPLPGALELLSSLPSRPLDHRDLLYPPTRRSPHQGGRAPLPKKMITSTDITHGKPHPEPYRKAANFLVFTPPTALSWKMLPPEFAPARPPVRESSLSRRPSGTRAARSRCQLDCEWLRGCTTAVRVERRI